MINLNEGAMTSIVDRCTLAGRPLDARQQKIIRAVLTEMLYISHCRGDAELVLMYQRNLLSEGQAAFWLGVDRLELRRMANEVAEAYDNLKTNLRAMKGNNP